jgi:glutamyl-tRNA synthetase
MSGQFDRVRVRLAPSPTGDPHVGHAYIGLFDYVFARKMGGDFILRIEDTDRTRLRPGSEEAILRALRWVGLVWNEGPDVGGPYGPYRQSERTDIYRKHAAELVESGAAYRCFCTPERLAEMRSAQHARGESFIGYDGLCRGLSKGEVQRRLEAGLPCTVRLKTPPEGETLFCDLVRGEVAFRNSEIDDQVLLKSDGFPTYHLACVVDDHLMKISHVIRAEEWISSTPKHVLLSQAFGWELPTFIHMPLLRNKDQSKISKRKNPTSLDWYRAQGYLPEALLNFLALMGWSLGDDREVFGLQEMIENFTWDRVKTSGPVFDLQKLDWLNGEYIRAMSAEDLLGRILAAPLTAHADQPASRLLAISRLVQERLKKLSEFDQLTAFFFATEPYEAADLVPKKKDLEFAGAALAAAQEALRAVQNWTAADLERAMQALCEERGWQRGDLYMPLRVALTCRRVSTPLFETMEVLGHEECLRRVQTALEKTAQL